MFERGLFIFHRDLRVKDNRGLIEACKACKTVIPIFIFTNEQIIKEENDYFSNNAVQFMIESLVDLQREIRKNNGTLYTFRGNMNMILSKLIPGLEINAVFFNQDITPYAKQRTRFIENICNKFNTQLIPCSDYYLFQDANIVSGSGDPYKKFTPYYRACLNSSVERVSNYSNYKFYTISSSDIRKLNKIRGVIHNADLDSAYSQLIVKNNNISVRGGRKEAKKVMRNIKHHGNYGNSRNDLSQNTTRLSAYMKFGCLSVREIFEQMKKLHGINHDLIRQLIWREFYAQLLDNEPKLLREPLKPQYKNIKWPNKVAFFNAWKRGNTGFPLVDAGMRELNTTGYMHNRARLVTSSLLIKTLLIDWRKGEKYFAQNLVDYDVASNNGNWQWVAGCGADSMPYFRIFSPWSQSEKYDSDCLYIKKWIPELASIPPNDIHKWHMTHTEHRVNYPAPIVDYSQQRDKFLKLMKKYL